MHAHSSSRACRNSGSCTFSKDSFSPALAIKRARTQNFRVLSCARCTLLDIVKPPKHWQPLQKKHVALAHVSGASVSMRGRNGSGFGQEEVVGIGAAAPRKRSACLQLSCGSRLARVALTLLICSRTENFLGHGCPIQDPRQGSPFINLH